MDTTLVIIATAKYAELPNLYNFRLIHPSGNYLITEAIRGLYNNHIARIIISGTSKTLGSDDIQEKLISEITDNFDIEPEFYLIDNYVAVVPLMINQIISKMDITGKLLIKDLNSLIKIVKPLKENTVIVSSIENRTVIMSEDKCFINGDKKVVQCGVEVPGKYVCSAYFFKEAKDFRKNIRDIRCLMSDIINNNTFYIMEGERYHDIGSFDMWLRYKNKYSVLFIDIDGILLYKRNLNNSDTRKKIKANIIYINKLYSSGYHYINLLTNSKVDSTLRKLLFDNNIFYHNIIGGIPESPRQIISSYDICNKNPYATAINLPKNSNTMRWRKSDD